MVKKHQEKGFLTPSFELQDFENLDFKINTPYYLPLNDQTDLTFIQLYSLIILKNLTIRLFLAIFKVLVTQTLL